jgi:hypothetical protein
MGMVLEDSTEVRRENTYKQVESGRGYRKETDGCPLTVVLPHRRRNLIPPIVISFSASMNLGVHIITIIFRTSMATRGGG